MSKSRHDFVAPDALVGSLGIDFSTRIICPSGAKIPESSCDAIRLSGFPQKVYLGQGLAPRSKARPPERRRMFHFEAMFAKVLQELSHIDLIVGLCADVCILVPGIILDFLGKLFWSFSVVL